MPLTRRQIYVRRRVAVFGAAAVLLGAGLYLPMTLLAPLGAVSAQVEPYTAPVQPAAELSFPGYGASAVGAVGFPGVLASAGVADPLPIASITKVITTLIVLEQKPLAAGESGPEITFGDIDEEFYEKQLAQDGSIKSVRSGLVLTERQVLELVLLASANNYADSLVHWAFGSEEAFLAAGASWLADHGLSQTTLVDPTGINPGNVSSAANLLEIAKLAVADPIVSEIIALPSAEIPGVGAIHNTNDLLGVDGVDGIKTGTLDESGACLLFSADYAIGSEMVTVVGVVLGGPDHDTIDEHIRTILAGVVAGFHEVPLTAKGDVFASYSTAWGDSADAVAAEASAVLVWADTPVSVLVQADELRLGEKGSAAGELTFTAGERTVTVPLVLDRTVDDPGPWWRLGNPGALF